MRNKGVLLYDSNGVPAVLSAAKGLGDTEDGAKILPVAKWLWDGTQFVREENNHELLLLASAARTVTTESAVQHSYNARGVILFLDVTGNPGGAETLTLTLTPYFNTGAQNSIDVCTFTMAAATNARYALIVYPGASTAPETATRNKAYSLICPRWFSGLVTPSGAGSWTYSLRGQLIV